jgi:hypothetical protein
MNNRSAVEAKYGQKWFRLWQVFLGWSVHIAAQGNSTCFQIVCNKNLETFNRNRFIGELGYEQRVFSDDAPKRKQNGVLEPA